MIRIPEAVEMDVVAGPGPPAALRAPSAPGPVTTSRPSDPDPEVAGDGPAPALLRRVSVPHPQASRRVQAARRGGGALLRREGLYSSLLTNWRRQREAGALREMRGRRRGPRPVDPRMKQLEAENRRLQRKLQRAETIITLQKKVAEILGIPLTPLVDDETD